MDFKKFVWKYIILNGYACKTHNKYADRPGWNHYFAHYQPIDEIDFYDENSISEWRMKFLEKIKEVGVDWKETKEPTGTSNSEFVSTYSPSREVECLYGTLILNNGEKFLMGCTSECSFEAYAKFFSMLENYNKSGKIFDKEL